MADRSALGRLGWTFGAVTAAVLLMTAVVVASHLDGRRITADGGGHVAAASHFAGTR